MIKKVLLVVLNIIMGIKFTTLFKMVLKNGIGLNPEYLLRVIFLIPNSLISQVLVVVEKLKYDKKVGQTVIEKPPVFIIGHWRSGTTFLHQLIYLDRQFTAPTIIQTVLPDHFLFSTKYYLPFFKKIMPEKRPMDEVELKPFAAMEDEFALVRMGSASPFLRVIFPSGKTKFLSDFGEFIPEGKELVKWKKNFLTFTKRITFLTGKQIVFKNPYHTPRMLLLSTMFPGARFIHLVRHPYKIIPSGINMWDIVSRENALKGGWEKPTIDEASVILEKFFRYVDENKSRLGKKEFTEIKYEDLEASPVDEIKRLYKELDLEFSAEFEERIIQFIEEKKNYKKNTFNLSSEEKGIIHERLSRWFQAYNYDKEQ
jgi:omega-hydroxy-beta-dihydromenaquinone-9 sulfotransferase